MSSCLQSRRRERRKKCLLTRTVGKDTCQLGENSRERVDSLSIGVILRLLPVRARAAGGGDPSFWGEFLPIRDSLLKASRRWCSCLADSIRIQ